MQVAEALLRDDGAPWRHLLSLSNASPTCVALISRLSASVPELAAAESLADHRDGGGYSSSDNEDGPLPPFGGALKSVATLSARAASPMNTIGEGGIGGDSLALLPAAEQQALAMMGGGIAGASPTNAMMMSDSGGGLNWSRLYDAAPALLGGLCEVCARNAARTG